MQFALQYMARDPKTGRSELKNFKVDETVYQKAAKQEMTLRQYLKASVTDCDYSYGEPLDQMLGASGLLQDKKLGMPNLTMNDLASGKLAAGQLRSPDGTDDSLGSRLLYPQLILETMAAELQDDGADIISKYNEMVAVTRNLNGKKADQPVIDTSAPKGDRSGHIAQLAEPETMVTITTGEKSYRIPTKSIGLTISDEAMEATTIDLVRVVMQTQARAERIAMIEGQLHAMVHGDKDRGMDPLPQRKASEFDSSISANGRITKRAYIKWLRDNYRIRSISHVLTSLDTALTMDEQLLPQQTGVDSSRIPTPFAPMSLDIALPKMVDFSDEMFGANTLVGLDSRNAIQRFVNVNADYDAIEDYVMRRAKSFRVDHGEMATRLYDEAWSVLSLTTA